MKYAKHYTAAVLQRSTAYIDSETGDLAYPTLAERASDLRKYMLVELYTKLASVSALTMRECYAVADNAFGGIYNPLYFYNQPERLTLSRLNKMVQAKYPLVKVVRGRGYYYIASDDDNMALKIASLYTTSIDVYAVHHLDSIQWMQNIEMLLRDEWRRPAERASII